jgi:hypothetical protein
LSRMSDSVGRGVVVVLVGQTTTRHPIAYMRSIHLLG